MDIGIVEIGIVEIGLIHREIVHIGIVDRTHRTKWACKMCKKKY